MSMFANKGDDRIENYPLGYERRNEPGGAAIKLKALRDITAEEMNKPLKDLIASGALEIMD